MYKKYVFFLEASRPKLKRKNTIFYDIRIYPPPGHNVQCINLFINLDFCVTLLACKWRRCGVGGGDSHGGASIVIIYFSTSSPLLSFTNIQRNATIFVIVVNK